MDTLYVGACTIERGPQLSNINLQRNPENEETRPDIKIAANGQPAMRSQRGSAEGLCSQE